MNNKGIGVFLTKKVITILIIVVALAGIGIGVKSVFFNESKSTTLGFEDIGELATQVAMGTTISVTEKSIDWYGMQVPFTQTKYIYSYDTKIKAGIDFGKIDWSVDEESKTIRIVIPEVKILSSEIDLDSFKVYHEKTSLFTSVNLEENNESLKELKRVAEETAIENGLLTLAYENAEVLLTAFVDKVYDLDVYTLKFSN